MKKKEYYLLILFFCLYFSIGYFYKDFLLDSNVFFGADTARIIDDIVIFNADHYRTKVHPLFVILINPMGIVLNFFIKNKVIASLLINSIFGSFTMIFMGKYLEISNISTSFKYLLLLIYSFSMSTLIFSSIPETFIFGAFSLILAHYFFKIIFLKINENKYDDRMKKDINFFVYTIILCFGITITNYIPALILLIGIIVKADEKRIINLFIPENNFKINKIKIFIVVSIITFTIGTLGTIGQKIIYRNSGVFFTKAIAEEFNYMFIGEKNIILKIKEVIIKNENLKSKIENLRGRKFDLEITEDLRGDDNKKNRLNFLKQTENVFKTFFMYNLISPLPENKKNNEIVFNLDTYKRYDLIHKSVIYTWIILIVVSLIFTISKKIYINYFVIICIFFNLFLHFIYGANESFLYSAHIFFLFILLFTNTLEKIKENRFFYNIYKIAIIYMTPIIIYNNIHIVIGIKTILSK